MLFEDGVIAIIWRHPSVLCCHRSIETNAINWDSWQIKGLKKKKKAKKCCNIVENQTTSCPLCMDLWLMRSKSPKSRTKQNILVKHSMLQYTLSSRYLGSLGDLLPLDIFGDFLPTQSSLSSMSLESEQLQLSIMADIRLLPYISSEERK